MKALKKNWKLTLIAAALIIVALIITMFPSLQADAQGCGKSGHTCYLRRYYTCVLRNGRRVCGSRGNEAARAVRR